MYNLAKREAENNYTDKELDAFCAGYASGYNRMTDVDHPWRGIASDYKEAYFYGRKLGKQDRAT